MTIPDPEETSPEETSPEETALEMAEAGPDEGAGEHGAADQDDEAGTTVEAQPEPEPEPEPEPVEPPKYYISFPRLDELNRSAVTLVAARRVESCPSMSKPAHELKDPQALITEIARHYQDDEDFIRTDMPMMEIVFRILLSRRNEPTSLTDLHYELTERWATPVRPINVTEVGLQRVLDGDNYYGFAQED